MAGPKIPLRTRERRRNVGHDIILPNLATPFPGFRGKGRRTYVDEPGVVSLSEIVEDGGVVEESEVGHVLAFLVLGRIHLGNQVLLERLVLKSEQRFAIEMHATTFVCVVGSITLPSMLTIVRSPLVP